jgi:hypothetical protein
MLQVWSVDANDGKIRIRIVTDQLRWKYAGIVKGDFQFSGAVHDMAVRENEAVGSNDQAAACASATAADTFSTNIHHTRRDAVGDRGNGAAVAIEQLRVLKFQLR